jgi:acetylornithine/N-succinyldiaminopimelate aminotransferase
VSNLYTVPEQEKLAATLCKLCFTDRAFFCNSGAEAIELSIKAARKYHFSKGAQEKTTIITFSGAFHGRTLGALSATGNAQYLQGFGPRASGFRQLPTIDLVEVEKAIDETTAAILVEPIQGESGIYPLTSETLAGLRSLCDFYGVLLIFDEVQTGVGRVGELFAHQSAQVEPDIMVLAKGLGAGFPVAACLAREDVAATMTPGTHGSTFGGNPLAMSVACAVVNVISEPSFLARVREAGARLMEHATRLVTEYPSVFSEVRGQGLMLGLQCVPPLWVVIEQLYQERLLCVKAGNNTVRLLPPLTISDAEIDDAMQRLFNVARNLSSEGSSGAAPHTVTA